MKPVVTSRRIVFGFHHSANSTVALQSCAERRALRCPRPVRPRPDPSVAGSSGLENSYLFDGVNTTDPAFGGSGTNVT